MKKRRDYQNQEWRDKRMGYAGKAKIGNLGKSIILGKYSRMWKILGSKFFKKVNIDC